MEKIKSLNRYQKGVLIFMIVIVITFFVLYSMTISQVGFEYKDTIFVPSQENGSTVYSGKIKGQQARFTVSEDKTVVFQHGDNGMVKKSAHPNYSIRRPASAFVSTANA